MPSTPPSAASASTEAAFVLDYEGQTLTLRLADFTGTDDLAVKQATGVNVFEIFEGEISLYTMAALIWRHLVAQGRADLAYSDVNNKMNFKVLETLRDEGPGETVPEA